MSPVRLTPPRELVVVALVALLATVAAPAAAQPLTPPEVTAEGAVLYDPAAEQVLYGEQEDVARPIASTSKIMTALLAIEAGTLDDIVTVSPAAVAVGDRPGSASLDLAVGQQIPMDSLLAGLLVRSGNDAAVAVAEHVAGDEAAFVAAMNARAAELGLSATRFVDSSGLGSRPPNVSSPLDLARLARVAMEEPVFAALVGLEVLDVPGLPPLPNRNRLLTTYPGATGVKTGYTRVAGLCLVASATRDGRALIAVVLDSERSFADAAALLNHGFDEWRRIVAAAAGEPVGAAYRWPGTEVALVAGEALAVTLPADQEAAGRAVSWRAVLDPVRSLPVEAGTPLGRAELRVDGEVVDAVSLHSAAAVAPPTSRPAPAAAVGRAVQDALRGYARLQPVDRAA